MDPGSLPMVQHPPAMETVNGESGAPVMQVQLQQLRVPWIRQHGQWRMVQSLDGELLNRGSWIYIQPPIREVRDQDEIVSPTLIIAAIPRNLLGREVDFFH